MVKHVCDRCNKDIEDIDKTSIFIPDERGGWYADGVKTRCVELCDDCYSLLRNWINNIDNICLED